jgi:hypothetical protein
MNEFPKSSKIIYRDIIKIVTNLIEPPKRHQMLKFVRKEFEKNRDVKNENDILKLKKQAANGIMNLYLNSVKSQIKDKPPNPNEKRINF